MRTLITTKGTDQRTIKYGRIIRIFAVDNCCVMRDILSILTTLLLFSFWSCNKPEANPTPIEDDEYITLPISVTGEIVNISEMPMTKSENQTDVYLIQVFISQENDSFNTDAESGFSPYAYGVFTDLTKASIRVNPKLTYHLVAQCFRGLEIPVDLNSIFIGCRYFKSGSNVFSFDENIMYSKDDNTNEFVYSNFYFSVPFYDGYGHVAGEGLDFWWESQNYDFYYSEIAAFRPSENSTISFDMIRCVFGLRCEVDNLSEFVDDHVFIEINPQFAKSGYAANSIDLFKDFPVYDGVNVFFKTRFPRFVQSGPEKEIWRNYVNHRAEYSETMPVIITHHRHGGQEDEIIFNDMITFTRNCKKVLTIHLNPETESKTISSLNVDFESVQMKEEAPIYIN